MPFHRNPVLSRELAANLRSGKTIGLLTVYQILIGLVVWSAWPADEALDVSTTPESAVRLVNWFLLGQYLIAALMAPSFTAAAIAGEKERLTYETLLASPIRPGSVVIGKLLAGLTHLALLLLSSLPVVVVCLPLGGISIYEVLAANFGIIGSVTLFGCVGLWCSGRFHRTTSALVVSYLIILPAVIVTVMGWIGTEGDAGSRLRFAAIIIPTVVVTVGVMLLAVTAARLLYPPDIGSQGKAIVDIEAENEAAIGLVIQSDQFPDRLLAPPRRDTWMADGVNPVYHKELHGEVFSQGTLMLRLVIQISMALAIVLMGVFLFWRTDLCVWFAVYILTFNLLVGPVFLAPSMTSERERQTLDLLLTTPMPRGRIVWGKFVVGLRISVVLTCLLVWPLLLGVALNFSFWSNLPAMAVMLGIVAMACLVNAAVATTSSVYSHRTTEALLRTYGCLLVLVLGPPAINRLAALLQWNSLPPVIRSISPLTALFAVPLDEQLSRSLSETAVNSGHWSMVAIHFVWMMTVLAGCAIGMQRWQSRLAS